MAFKDMRMARDMAKSYYHHFNCPSEIMVSEAKCLCKRALQLMKNAKWEYYLKLTKEADMRNMWDFHKWTSGKHTYTSLTLLSGEGGEPAVTHTNKCNLLRTTVTLGSPRYGQGLLGLADIRSATRLPPQPLGPPGVPLAIWG